MKTDKLFFRTSQESARLYRHNDHEWLFANRRLFNILFFWTGRII